MGVNRHSAGQVFLLVLSLIALGIPGNTIARANDLKDSHPDSSLVKQVIRSFYDTQTIGARFSIPEKDQSTEAKSARQIYTLLSTGFEPKDIWGNREYIFGYGTYSDGSLILFGWKNDPDAPQISFDELGSDYSDERLAQVQDEKGLKEWKQKRASVVGSFLSIKRKETRFESLYPASHPGEYQTGREQVASIQLNTEPVIIRVVPQSLKDKKIKSLLSSIENYGTR